MSQSNTDLPAIIAEEQKHVAHEFQSEAWVGGISNGIEPEILAEAAFDTALKYLLQARSEKQVLKLLSRMHDKVIRGELSDHKTIQ
ncbi:MULTISPECIES: hypothetical protein [Bartonella]|uniref:Uncharacterized protein n=1 Tax=Bartonella choladocola TaxID=2750995 RepID=A0A1U9MH18_9HYPH|nr:MULTISPECIES: hypothetical protein [Bartonella]AQT46972.1 hypothetical protein BBC0122_008460 [Bartonella choladocola]MBH9975140.1 hypothetical protein [Bartonella choladocola]MBI0014746.1 hypothetical protein [Bartonella sp. B10834G3]MBI0140324.1 hypothetical protein [Bartonella choladocola]